MKHFLSGVPIPLAGVALAFAALGNLLGTYYLPLKYICGLISLIFILLILLKVVFCFDQFKKDMQNPIVCSVSAAVFMTIMQLATYVVSFNQSGNLYPFADWLWFIAVVGHVLLILYFTYLLFFKLKLHHIYPTVFVTYVGIIVASITSPTFNAIGLGRMFFWFGFVMYAIMFVVITMRYVKHEVEEAARPLFVLYAAPMSLTLTGFLTVYPHANGMMTLVMEVLAQLLYVVAVLQIPKLVRLPFYPSYAAFTFPLIITPFALNKVLTTFSKEYGFNAPTLIQVLYYIEVVFGICLVAYSVFEYCKYLYNHYLSGKNKKSV